MRFIIEGKKNTQRFVHSEPKETSKWFVNPDAFVLWGETSSLDPKRDNAKN